MTDKFIMAIYQRESDVETASEKLKTAVKEGLPGLLAVAQLRKDEHNKIHMKEMGDLAAGKGALAGAVLGVIVGALTGGLALILGAAFAAVGGLVAKGLDHGIPDNQLKKLTEKLDAGTSAIVIITEEQSAGPIADLLKSIGGDVHLMDVPPELAAKVEGASREHGVSIESTDSTFTTGSASAAASDAMEGLADSKGE